MLKAVLFDMDGVIVDSEPVYVQAEMELAGRFHIPFSTEVQKRYVGVHHEVMWSDLKKLYGFDCQAAELSAMEDAIINDHYEKGALIPIPETVELIRKAHAEGIMCAIATSNTEKNAAAVIKRLGLESNIAYIASSCKVVSCKPAPDIYYLALAELGVKAEECVAIDDSEKGIWAAKAAGLHAIGYVNPNAGKQDFGAADFVTCDMADVTLPLLRGLCG